MRALVKRHSEPGLWLEEVPRPEVGEDDVLIRVLKNSICGTDVHIYNWDAWAQKTIPVPMVTGHEFVGRIEAVGRHVHDFHPGEIVSGEGHVVCGRCRNCLAGRRHLCAHTMGVGVNRPGAFAEYLSIPETNVWHCDPNIPLEVLSCFDPLGNAVHTALSFDVLGEDVLITGAGPIGCMAAGRRQPRRGAFGGRHRREPLPPRPRPPARRDRRRRCQQGNPRGRAGPARHAGRLRRRPGNERQRRGLQVDDRQHVPRRQNRAAGHRHPRRGGSHRLGRRRFQRPDHQGHLRPRDVRDLVQDDCQ